MPLKPQDTDKLKTPPADTFGKKRNKGKNTDRETAAKDVQVNYGFARNAELNTAAEETEEQEYAANGLPRTTKYSVDKH
jgi:hypothetical protein